jgi:hypothetical protein
MSTTFPKSAPKEIEREIGTFQRNYADIARHAGEYALIQGDSVAYFPSYSEAIANGYERFGLGSFLVKQIRLEETPVGAMRCGTVERDGRLRLTRAKKR